MGVGRRLLDLARANLNTLLDRAAAAEAADLTEEQLRAELERRDHERAAHEEERKRRLAAEEQAKARARTRASAGPPRPATHSRAARIAELSRTLGVRPGVSADELKRAYRALMREHHPDRHAGDPQRQKAASARAAAITTAYAELERLREER